MTGASSAFLEAHPLVDKALSLGFDAVLEPSQWPDFANALARALNAQAFCFHHQGAGENRLALPASDRYRDLLLEFLKDGWSAHDLRAKRGWPLVRAGRRVILECDVSSTEERAVSPLYQQLFKRHDLFYFGGMGFQADGKYWAANVLRSEREGPVDEAGASLLQGARPHIARLVTYAARMANAASFGALTALECAGQPALVLDRLGRISLINESARAVLGQGLATRNGKLCADNAGADNQLQAATRAPQSAFGQTISVRRGGRQPLVVEIIRTTGLLAEAIGAESTLVLITDLERRTTAQRGVLRDAFGLTPRETDIAHRLGAGQTSDQIATGTGLRPSSVRQLIKAVLAKTHTGRQSELIALLSRLRSAPSAD